MGGLDEPHGRASFATTGSRDATRTSRGSLYGGLDGSHGTDASRPTVPAFDTFEVTTLDPAHPRELHTPVVALSGKVYRQLLGLNPFKTSYISLYTSVDGIRHKLLALGGVLFAIAAGLPLPLIGIIFGKLISSFPPSEDELRLRIAQLLGVAAAFFAVTAAYATLFGFTGERIAIHVRQRLLDCLLHLDQSYLDTHDIDVNGLLSEKVDTIHAGCSEKVGIFVQSISYFVAAFTVGFILSPRLTGILLAVVLPTLVAITLLARRYGSRYSKQSTQYAESANGIVESALRSVKVIQAFGMMQRLGSTHFDVLGERGQVSMRKAVVAAVQVGSIYFLAYSINGLAFYLGSHMAVAGQAGGESGTIFAVVFLILDSSLVVAQFAPFLEIFAQAAAAQGVIQELLEARQNLRPAVFKANCAPLQAAAIKLNQVTFSYPARPTTKALNSLSLVVRPGTLTALVGPSGGGKSTLVSILTGTYPYSGGIHLGEQELRDIDITSLRSQLAVVEQDHNLFTGTIYDNICNGIRCQGLDAAELTKRVDQAVRDAKVDFLERLPHGIHTHLGDGLQLSGGQQQRICLARALIRRPAMLILDEPTSALDAQSEVIVMQAVKGVVASGTTVIMVAHRLSTVVEADHVAVLGDGRVVEEGSPLDLSVSDGVFRSLLDAQNTNIPTEATPEINRTLQGTKGSSVDKSEGIEASESGNTSVGGVSHNIGHRALATQIMNIVKPDAGIVVLGVCAAAISGGLLLAEAIIFGNLVELLNLGVDMPQFQSHANFYCLMFFVVGCVGLVSWVTSGTAFGIASSKSLCRVQSRLLSKLLLLDMEWFAAPGRSVHDLMSAFTKDSGDLSCLSGPALGTVFTTLTSVAGGTILALCVAWKIAIVLLAAVPVMLAAGFIRIRVLARADHRRRDAYRQATSRAAEACRNRTTVALYGLEGYILEQYKQSLQGPVKDGRLFTVSSNVILAISLSITYFVYALAYWWGARQVRNGEYSTKDFFTVLPAMLFSAQSAGQLFSLAPEIARAKAAVVSISKLLNHQPLILDDTQTPGSNFKEQLPAPSPDLRSDKDRLAAAAVEFAGVSLSYSAVADRPVLQDVSLEILKGQSVAFVGPSGAGKSTAVALIERFYDPGAGYVRIDGTDLRHFDVGALRSRIGLVSQNPDLLPGSIAYNVRLGASDEQTVSDAEVQLVCKRCGLHDFVQSLPDGYNTECGSSATSKLSGGQRQRIALARALLRNPEILLLDEPTSALDAHSEQHIQATLADAAVGRTTITVAHRLASIRDVDSIFVFDGGRVVEQGTHGQLVAKGALYASMAKAQSVV